MTWDDNSIRRKRAATTAIGLAIALICTTADRSLAQTPGSEEARTIEFGKDIFKTKARCQFCHKWDGTGDQGYGGNALSLRKTQMTREQVTETVKCGRLATEMPFHDKFAYTDKRCFGVTREQAGGDMPPEANQYLQPSEIAAIVTYVFERVVGRGEPTYSECVDFWGKDTQQCEPLKK